MAIFKRASTFHVSQQPPGWVTSGWGLSSVSGEDVNAETALGVPAVYSCITLLADDIASLPLILYRRLERGKERAAGNSYYTLMHDAPNPEHTSFVFRQLMMGHLLAWGNFYAQKIWDDAGVVRELWPLSPDRMQVFRDGGMRKYLYRKQDGQERAFRAEEILHIPGFGYDGLVGYSPIQLAVNTIGLAMSAEKYTGNVFANDARPTVALIHPGKLQDEKVTERLINQWNQNYKGPDNAGKAVVLEEGMSVKEIGFPPKDTQFIETQKWSLLQYARMYHIPPHMIGAVEVSTSWGSGIEQQEQGYINHTLRSLTRRVEQQLNKDILLEAQRREYFYEHLFDDLLRGDTNSRYTAYGTAITNGFMTRNEAREKENWNPLEGLDEPLVPLNMANANDPDPEPEPEPEPVPVEDDGNDETVRAFVMDAAERCVRREMNEVNDAAKRWLDKARPEKFAAWLEEFYKRDHVHFIQRTLAPLISGKTNIPYNLVIADYCNGKEMIIERAIKEEGSLFSSQSVAAITATWMECLPDQLAESILGKENA